MKKNIKKLRGVRRATLPLAAGLVTSAAVLISVSGSPLSQFTQEVSTPPPYSSSVTGTDFDYIIESDPNVFESLTYVGFKDFEMPDKRNLGEPLVQKAYVFDAHFLDGTKISIAEDKDFGSKEAAEKDALRYVPRLGKLPSLYRQKIKHVVVHQGGIDTTSFAEEKGHFFTIYSDNATKRIGTHDLEETFFHEGSHASIQDQYLNGTAWQSAKAADNKYITNYASTDPGEDFAESALFAYTIIYHPERFPAADREKIEKQIPNRIAFFRTVYSGSAPAPVLPSPTPTPTPTPTPPAPTDVCSNIAGVQSEVPSGYVKDSSGSCVTTPVNTPTTPTTYAPPTGQPAPGKDPSPQTVTLSAPGSTSIRYGTNGNDPTCSTGTLYTQALPVHVTTTIKAIACYSNGTSSVATLQYTIKTATSGTTNPPTTPNTDVCPNISGTQTSIPAGQIKNGSGDCVTTPVATSGVYAAPTGQPAPGKDPSPQTVTLSAPGSTSIRYTTVGTDPTCTTGTLYSQAFPVHVTTTVKAIACYPTGTSQVATLQYNIGKSKIPATTVVKNQVIRVVSTTQALLKKLENGWSILLGN